MLNGSTATHKKKSQNAKTTFSAKIFYLLKSSCLAKRERSFKKTVCPERFLTARKLWGFSSNSVTHFEKNLQLSIDNIIHFCVFFFNLEAIWRSRKEQTDRKRHKNAKKNAFECLGKTWDPNFVSERQAFLGKSWT